MVKKPYKQEMLFKSRYANYSCRVEGGVHMDEVIFKLRGISALLYSLAMVDENSVLDGLDSACMILNQELHDCIKQLENEVS